MHIIYYNVIGIYNIISNMCVHIILFYSIIYYNYRYLHVCAEITNSKMVRLYIDVTVHIYTNRQKTENVC